MGLATRWLRSLWGRRKKESSHPREESPGHNRREGKRSSFTKSRREESDVELGRNADTAVAEAAWIRSLRAEREVKSEHALAVAAATAAAADAAVAAAQAAVAVVRLTSQGWSGIASGSLERHSAAATKIQTAFRRYLAKKAFRALKALVKLQALVRGYLVRRQAAATLHSMQALIKVQAAVRARRARSLLLSDSVPREFLPRRSLERYDETRSAHTPSLHSRRLSATLDSAKTAEMDTSRSRWRSARRSDDDYLHSFSSTIEYRCNFQEDEKCRLPLTAQSTPRCTSSSGYVDEEGALGRFWNAPRRPSYMAKTQSFKAKLRSQSAPRQRAGAAGPAGARQWSSELPMQKSCSRALQASFDFKSAIVGKLDKSGFNINS